MGSVGGPATESLFSRRLSLTMPRAWNRAAGEDAGAGRPGASREWDHAPIHGIIGVGFGGTVSTSTDRNVT